MFHPLRVFFKQKDGLYLIFTLYHQKQSYLATNLKKKEYVLPLYWAASSGRRLSGSSLFELIIRARVPGSSGANLRIHEVTVKD